jgi:hypothetical protein
MSPVYNILTFPKEPRVLSGKMGFEQIVVSQSRDEHYG